MPQCSTMLRAALLLATFSVSLAGFAAGKCERLVATGNPEYPPYLWRDPMKPERLIGANADLLEEIGKAIGVDIRVIYTGSWARAQEEARLGRVDLIAGAFLTPARMETMDYVHPAFLTTDSVVWTRKDTSIPFTHWEDLRGLKGGTLVNNSFGAQFDSFAKQQLTLEEVPSLTQAFQKLLLKRSDYVIYEHYPGLAVAATLGMVDDLQPLEPPVSSEGLYLTLSHNSACNDPWLRGQLAKKMTELTAAGVPQRLLQDNLARWKGQQLQPASTPTQ
ncbi:ABC transporter substrate-binding protein [Pseudomonas sp. SCB32]|uniref:substrate-binding periplasmic protein n=1 Tax=Pseudomonas sp. SCB32 TaxID=2653853 RepID=UPI001264CACF|nr:transporter substrate-binding domain-containing protein [Pseudomonas sp. SCB32]